MIENLFLIYIMLFSGSATLFYRSPEGLISLLTITLLLFFKNKHKFNKSFYKIIIVWIIYIILLYFKFKEFHPYFAIIIPTKFLAGYFLLTHFKKDFFIKFEKIIYVLSAISLFFWAWSFFDSQSLLQVLKVIDVSGGYMKSENYANSIVFTYNTIEGNSEIPRNCGFCWEPGPFSIFIVTAIFFNLARTNFRLKNNNALLILLLTLLTTQSTTGILAFFILCIWFTFNKIKDVRKIIYVVFVVIPFIIVLFVQIPYLQEKVLKDYTDALQTEDVVYDYTKRDISIAPTRTTSLVIAWKDFINNPILGYGGQQKAKWTNKIGGEVWVINGIGNIIAMYGLFGIFFFLLALFKSTKALSLIYNYNYPYFWVLIILVFAYGFSLIETPVFISIIFFPLMVNLPMSRNAKKYTPLIT